MRNLALLTGCFSLLSLTSLASLVACGAPPSASLDGTSASKNGGVAASSATRRYEPASALALPSAECALHTEGTAHDDDATITIATDDEGVARFHAVRPRAAEDATRLVLDCRNASGAHGTYRVDLTSDATFVDRPFDRSRAPGVDRGPLVGNPLSHSFTDLIRDGYGPRPDPVESPGAYADWLTAARQQTRFLQAKSQSTSASPTGGPAPSRRVPEVITTGTGNNWVGTVLHGESQYVQAWSNWSVPTAEPDAYGTGTTRMSFFVGLGGWNVSGPNGLMKEGVAIQTTPSVASYSLFWQYGSAAAHSTAQMTTAPGHRIYAMLWYCDATGLPTLNGGYGCTQFSDFDGTAALSCRTPNDPTCPSIPLPAGATIGKSAEWVAEFDGSTGTPTFTPFLPAVSMTAGVQCANATPAGWYPGQSIVVGPTTDPATSLLRDSTNSILSLSVSLGKANDNSGNDAVILSEDVRGMAPVIGWMSKTGGPNVGGTVVEIEGANFSTTPNGMTITFGSTKATGVSCPSAHQCFATSPPLQYEDGFQSTAITVPVVATIGSLASASVPQSQFTYAAGPSCTTAYACAGNFGSPLLNVTCPSTTQFYILGGTPSQQLVGTGTSYTFDTSDVGVGAIGCVNGSCTTFQSIASETYCGTLPTPPPNFCQECVAQGGICAGTGAKRHCIYE